MIEDSGKKKRKQDFKTKKSNGIYNSFGTFTREAGSFFFMKKFIDMVKISEALIYTFKLKTQENILEIDQSAIRAQFQQRFMSQLVKSRKQPISKNSYDEYYEDITKQTQELEKLIPFILKNHHSYVSNQFKEIIEQQSFLQAQKLHKNKIEKYRSLADTQYRQKDQIKTEQQYQACKKMFNEKQMAPRQFAESLISFSQSPRDIENLLKNNFRAIFQLGELQSFEKDENEDENKKQAIKKRKKQKKRMIPNNSSDQGINPFSSSDSSLTRDKTTSIACPFCGRSWIAVMTFMCVIFSLVPEASTIDNLYSPGGTYIDNDVQKVSKSHALQIFVGLVFGMIATLVFAVSLWVMPRFHIKIGKQIGQFMDKKQLST